MDIIYGHQEQQRSLERLNHNHNSNQNRIRPGGRGHVGPPAVARHSTLDSRGAKNLSLAFAACRKEVAESTLSTFWGPLHAHQISSTYEHPFLSRWSDRPLDIFGLTRLTYWNMHFFKCLPQRYLLTAVTPMCAMQGPAWVSPNQTKFLFLQPAIQKSVMRSTLSGFRSDQRCACLTRDPPPSHKTRISYLQQFDSYYKHVCISIPFGRAYFDMKGRAYPYPSAKYRPKYMSPHSKVTERMYHAWRRHAYIIHLTPSRRHCRR